MKDYNQRFQEKFKYNNLPVYAAYWTMALKVKYQKSHVNFFHQPSKVHNTRKHLCTGFYKPITKTL